MEVLQGREKDTPEKWIRKVQVKTIALIPDEVGIVNCVIQMSV